MVKQMEEHNFSLIHFFVLLIFLSRSIKKRTFHLILMTKLQQLVQNIQSGTMKTELPDLRVGDLVRIGVSIQEGNKQRIQPFEGTVIAKHQAGADSTITVRKTLQGVGVERVFPLYAPCVANIQILRRAQVSRAKLYYLRNRTGKATRLKEKFELLPDTWMNSNPQESEK
jgi:large subunit ribosomal protein L19